MKKLVIAVLLVLLTVPAFAATNPAVKGNFSVSLPLFSYWTGIGDLDESSYFSFLAVGLEPDVQYFVMDDLSVGGKVGYISDENGGVKTKTTLFGPMANYYFSFIKAPVLPYAGAGLIYEQNKYDGAKEKTTELRLHGGAVYMLGKHLSAYGEILLSPYVKYSNGESISGQKLGISAGIRAFF
ncbi:MAG: outer membrane beta-barrel protein [Spirochaetes bacterium]|nr:outer membrane beta-barrel protein [Spirochaetota bacterium]